VKSSNTNDPYTNAAVMRRNWHQQYQLFMHIY